MVLVLLLLNLVDSFPPPAGFFQDRANLIGQLGPRVGIELRSPGNGFQSQLQRLDHGGRADAHLVAGPIELSLHLGLNHLAHDAVFLLHGVNEAPPSSGTDYSVGSRVGGGLGQLHFVHGHRAGNRLQLERAFADRLGRGIVRVAAEGLAGEPLGILRVATGGRLAGQGRQYRRWH